MTRGRARSQARLAGVLAAATLAAGACGSSSPAPTASSPARTGLVADGGPLGGYGGEAPGEQAPSQAVTGPTFPLTLRRTGGSAQFQDTIVLQGDGRLSVDSGAFTGRVCVLGGNERRELLAALSTLRLAGTPAAPSSPSEPGLSDPIRISVTDVHARPVELADPSLGAVAGMVAALVSDVTLTSPAMTRCTPATGR